MSFVYEDISKEDFEKFGIAELKAKYQSPNFDMWAINESRDIYLILTRHSILIDDEDFGVHYYAMNFGDFWADFEAEIIAHGGEYKGETWVKYGITKISPFTWDSSGQKQRIEINSLSIPYEAIISTFCEALTARSNWMSHKSTKHDVFFENLTQKVEA